MSDRSALPHLIVDGYNIIGQGYRELFDRDPDTARARLLDDVSSYASGRFEALLVFDAHANPSSDGTPHEVAGVEVVFSPSGVEADTVIEQRAMESSAAGRRVLVATSDTETRHAVARPRVDIQSAQAFVMAMHTEAETSSELGEEVVRSRVEDLVDDVTRRRLMEWARGG